MKESNKKAVDGNEETFQKALAEWLENNNKKSWDQMFECVYKACLYIGKSKCYNLVVRDLEDKAMDATLDVMTKIKNGTIPKKLSSFCYLYTIGKIWNKKEIRWDRSEEVTEYLKRSEYSLDSDDNNNVVIFTNRIEETL